MTEKQQLIQAFKELNFDLLNQLLDDNKSYMEVSKELFLSTLKEKVSERKGLFFYEKVEEGICRGCNSGCVGYSFIAEKQPSLNLLFEETDGKINNILLCISLHVDSSNSSGDIISFSFQEEDKLHFTPSVEYSIQMQKIHRAIEEYEKLAINGVMPIEAVVTWYGKVDFLLEDLGWKNWDTQPNYKDFKHLKNLMSDVRFFVEKHKLVPLAKEALAKYEIVRYIEERDIIEWLIEYEHLFDFSMEILMDRVNNGKIALVEDENLAIDFSGQMDWLVFEKVYSEYYWPLYCKHVDCNQMFDLTDVPNADLLEILLGPKDFK